MWGGIATGLFASRDVNPALHVDGSVFGDAHLLGAQLVAMLVTIALAIMGTLVCVGLTRLVCGGLRVSAREERVGLDLSQQGERAYPSFNGLDD